MLCIDSLFNDYNKLTVVYNYGRIFDSFIGSYSGGCCILYYGNAVYKNRNYPNLQNFENEREITSQIKKFFPNFFFRKRSNHKNKK